jgi:hypothetical protein
MAAAGALSRIDDHRYLTTLLSRLFTAFGEAGADRRNSRRTGEVTHGRRRIHG